jgi:hypothetical protein
MEPSMDQTKNAFVIKDFYSPKEYESVMNTAFSFPKSEWEFQEGMDRYVLRNRWTDKLGIYEIDRARNIFNSESLLLSYSLIAIYNNPTSNLQMHKDDNACTYTIDVCIKCKDPWPLIIEGEEYIAGNNDAVCFYGNDQIHGRPPFKEGNSVMVMFLHYVERDHWWFEPSNKECV